MDVTRSGTTGAPLELEPSLPEPGGGRRGLAGRPEQAAHGVARDAAVYSVGIYVSQGLLFAAGLLQKALLGPTGTGYWTLMTTFYAYFGIASFGVFHAAWREVPSHRGRSDYAGAEAVANTASSTSVAAATTVGLVVAAVALVSGGSWNPELRFGLIVLGLITPLRAFVDAHEMLLQVTKRFSVLSITLVLKALATLSAQTLLVVAFGYYGMFAGVVVVALVALSYWRKLELTGRRNPAFIWSIERARVRGLAGIGFPIMIYTQVWVLFVSIDNLIVARYVGVTGLGIYALAVSATSYVMLLPNAIATALFPRMQERFGATNDARHLRGFVMDPQLLIATAVAPVLVGGLFFLLPVLIRHALPAFAPAIGVVHLMLAGSFAMALVYMPLELLLTTGRRWATVGVMLGCLAFNAGSNYVAVAVLHDGIRGAAYATALSYIALLGTSTVCALGRLLDTAKLARHLAVLTFAFGLTIAALWAIESVRPTPSALLPDVLSSTGALAVFLILLSPSLLYAERRFRLIHVAAATVLGSLRSARELFS